MATPQVPDQPNPDFAWQGGKEEPYNMGSLQVFAEDVPTTRLHLTDIMRFNSCIVGGRI